MNNKKEYERDELHKAIWKIANDLRGSVDGWDFKQYVLGFLFYRFISENLTDYINKLEPDDNFDYAKLSDEQAEYGRNETLREKGFYILPSELFCNVRKRAKQDADLNVTLNNVFNNIENSAKGTDSEDDMKGLFDDIDVNSNKLGNTVKERNDKLVKILDSIGDLPLGNYQDNTIDVFGDAYEYLMTMYASNAGKSGGEFFTPQEVGELLAKITLMDKKEVNKVYDPCCGSGGLLLKFAKILGKDNVKEGFYGQEINLTTYNLARINMFLHDINYNKFSIARGDTLIDPKHWDDEPFDAIVSNPPYSIKWAGKSNPLLINDERFAPAGILAPESKADLAFTMHILSWLSANGTAAIVEFPGVLYRGRAEQKIRQYMLENNFVESIIQLPENLFFGTGIGTCILVLKKNKNDNNVLFVDASDEYKKNGNKNVLSETNINNILNIIKKRSNLTGKSLLVKNNDIINNESNLLVSAYVTKPISKEKYNIDLINTNIYELIIKENETRNKLDVLIKNTNKRNNKVDLKPISTYFDIITGMTGVSKKWATNGNCIFIDYMNVYKNTTVDISNTPFATVKSLNQSKLKKGDILLTCASETPDECAISSVVKDDIQNDIFLDDHLFGLRLKEEYSEYINPTFINYYFHSEEFRVNLHKAVRGVTRFYISNPDFMKIPIAIPHITIQNEIVSLLDEIEKIEKLLMQEVKFRKEQFNYYKEQLLSFEEVSCE